MYKVLGIVLLLLFSLQVDASINTITVYPEVNDDSIRSKSQTWQGAYGADVGEKFAPFRDNGAYQTYVSGDYYVKRSFMSFDTSAVPEGSEILNAEIIVYVHSTRVGDLDEYAYVAGYASSPATPLSLDLDDFDQCGDLIGAPEELTEYVLVKDVAQESFVHFDFTNDGLQYVNKNGVTSICFREGHDVKNVVPNLRGGTQVGLRWYEVEDVLSDLDVRPRLVITYETPDEPETREGLYTQLESPYPSLEETAGWADDLYAEGSDYLCGSTIAECGCAITSVVMVGRDIGIETDVLGDDVNPGNINTYLQSVGGYTSYGTVRWLAASAYLGRYGSDGKLMTKLGAPTFTSDGNAMNEIDAAFATGTNAIIAFNGSHFVWLSEKTEDSYVVFDPAWYNTKTANDAVTGEAPYLYDYNNQFKGARIFPVYEEYQSVAELGIEAEILTETAQLLFTNAVGERVGYDGGEIVVDLDAAHYGDIENISLTGNLADAPKGKHLLVYDAGKEFTIEVVGTGEGEYSLEFFTLNEFGETTSFAVSGETYPGVTTTFTFDPETGEITEQPLTAEDIDDLLNEVLGGLTIQQQKFFRNWIDRFFVKQESKTASQLLQQVETLKKLFKAKKVEHPLSPTVIDVLTDSVEI